MGLYIKKTQHGRGIFTDTKLPAKKVVELCPVIVLSPTDYKKALTTVLGDYVYKWPGPTQHINDGENWNWAAVALGYGSLYNHSETPNIFWYIRRATRIIVIMTLTPIKPHTELRHNYSWPSSQAKTLE